MAYYVWHSTTFIVKNSEIGHIFKGKIKIYGGAYTPPNVFILPVRVYPFVNLLP